MNTKKILKEVAGVAFEAGLIGLNAYFAAKPLEDALSNYDRQRAITLLEEYISKYGVHISVDRLVTGNVVGLNHYDDKPDYFIQNEMRNLIDIIRTTETLKEGAKTVAKKAEELYKEELSEGENNAY